MNLSQLITELKEKAAKATPKCTWVAKQGSYKDRYWVDGTKHSDGACVAIFTKVEAKHIAACSPETVLALITALREAEEAMSMGAFHHNSCPWLNGKECYCAREKVDKWLAKYARGEE